MWYAIMLHSAESVLASQLSYLLQVVERHLAAARIDAATRYHDSVQEVANLLHEPAFWRGTLLNSDQADA
jgi:hypothetical protein